MSVSPDTLALYDELTSQELANLTSTLKESPQLASAFADWIQLRGALREELKQRIVAHELLLLYAIDRRGSVDAFTEREREALAAVRGRLDAAFVSDDTVRAIVTRMIEEQTDFESVWSQSIEEELEQVARSPASAWKPLRGNRFFTWQAAAAVALAALVGLLLVTGRFTDRTLRVATGENEIKTVTLGDGSTVRLMSETTLTYEQGTTARDFDRRVSLVGQGLFTVAPSDDVFLVKTPTALTTVWGTTFGIDADQSFTEVVLAEGRLSVSSVRDAQDVVVLEKGEMSRVLGSNPPSKPVRVDIADALQWTSLFVFRDEPVDRVVERLSKHFGVSIALAPTLGTESITGTFEHNWDLNYILQTIASSLDTEVLETGPRSFQLISD